MDGRAILTALRAFFILLVLAGSMDVLAQESQWIRQVDVNGGAGKGEVVVRFACPMRYLSHFPLRAGDELRIALAPLPGCPSGLAAARESMPGDGINPARLMGTEFDGGGGGNPILTLRFAKLLEYEVQPEPDFGGLRVKLPAAGPVPVRTLAGGQKPRSDALPTARGTAGTAHPPVRPMPSPEVLSAQLREARQAFDAKDHETAIRLYTRLVEYPEYPQRREALELLGLARERHGQLAHAKAEYEDYLRVYPESQQAERVQQRLTALVTLDPSSRGTAKTRAEGPWEFFGGLSQEYRRDSASIEFDGFSQQFTALNALRTDADFSARRRGQRYDLSARINGGFLKDLLPQGIGPGNDFRLSYAFLELTDREWQVTTRLGRQSRHTGGVLGTFDGFYAGWKPSRRLRVNLVAGLPVDRSSEGFSTNRQFAGLSVDIGTKGGHWDYSLFAIQQEYDGQLDRQAVGGEVRYFKDGTSLVGLVDYDIHYQALNSAMLLGTLQWGDRWTVTGTLDHRKAPYLTTRNALIGQPFRTLRELVGNVGMDTAEQWAMDRTGESDTVSLGVSRPWGERLQWNVDLTVSRFGELKPSGGVEGIPGTGLDKALSAQLLANSFFTEGDSSIVGLRVSQGELMTAESLYLSSRFPVWNGLRAGPRLRVDHRSFSTDGGDQYLVSPSLRLDWRGRRTTVEFEAGGEWANREAPLTGQSKDRRWWISLGYRLDF
jgi:hypothetical protein